MIASLLLLAAAQGQFILGDLSDFNGRNVGGVVFGVSTDSSLKSQFKVEKGAIRPEALVISNTQDSRVDALLDGRGGKAQAIGVFVNFKRLLDADKLAQGLGTPEVFYMRDRASDWVLHVYEKQGVAIFGLQDRSGVLAEAAVLADPLKIRKLGQMMSGEQTRVRDLQAEFDRLDQTVYIRDVNVNFSSRNIRIDNQDDERRNLRNLVERRFESRFVRYRSSGKGTISVNVDIDFTKVNVNASVSGSNEAGQVSGSGSGSDKFRESNDYPYYRRGLVEDLVRDAVNRAVDGVEDSIRKQKPQTPTESRFGQYIELLNFAIR